MCVFEHLRAVNKMCCELNVLVQSSELVLSTELASMRNRHNRAATLARHAGMFAFRPQTNPLPAHMSAARAYLQQVSTETRATVCVCVRV